MKLFLVRNNIHDLRADRGLTQEELATRAGVSRQTILSIEHGNKTPSVLLALRIADALDFPLPAVFSTKGNGAIHSTRRRGPQTSFAFAEYNDVTM